MSTSVAWEHELQSWLEPFLKPLHHPAHRRMCPLYVAGLIGLGERKSLQPMAARGRVNRLASSPRPNACYYPRKSTGHPSP